MRVRKVGEEVWKSDDGFWRARNVLESVRRHGESPTQARRPDSIPNALGCWKRGDRINPPAISFRICWSIARLLC